MNILDCSPSSTPCHPLKLCEGSGTQPTAIKTIPRIHGSIQPRPSKTLDVPSRRENWHITCPFYINTIGSL